jgi:hypothetical protein
MNLEEIWCDVDQIQFAQGLDQWRRPGQYTDALRRSERWTLLLAYLFVFVPCKVLKRLLPNSYIIQKPCS